MKDQLLTFFKKAIAWIRNEDTNQKIIETLDKLNDKIDTNEKSRLRAEIVRYYNIALRGNKIYPDEITYLRDEVFTKYTGLNGNGQAKHMFDYVTNYYEKQEETNHDK